MAEVAKVTVIVETKRQRRTFVYPKAYDIRFNEEMPQPHRLHSDNGAYMTRHDPQYMNTQFEMVNGKDGEGHFRTMVLEELDPVPDDIREIVTKATQHNINEAAREKLIKQLTQLVETDRKENSK